MARQKSTFAALLAMPNSWAELTGIDDHSGSTKGVRAVANDLGLSIATCHRLMKRTTPPTRQPALARWHAVNKRIGRTSF